MLLWLALQFEKRGFNRRAWVRRKIGGLWYAYELLSNDDEPICLVWISESRQKNEDWYPGGFLVNERWDNNKRVISYNPVRGSTNTIKYLRFHYNYPCTGRGFFLDR